MAPFEFAWPPFEQSASSGTSAYDQQTRGIPRSGTSLPPDGGSGKEPLGQGALATACCRLDGNGLGTRAIWHRPNQERSRALGHVPVVRRNRVSATSSYCVRRLTQRRSNASSG